MTHCLSQQFTARQLVPAAPHGGGKRKREKEVVLELTCLLSKERLTTPAKGEMCTHPPRCNEAALKAHVAKHQNCPVPGCTVPLERMRSVQLHVPLQARRAAGAPSPPAFRLTYSPAGPQYEIARLDAQDGEQLARARLCYAAGEIKLKPLPRAAPPPQQRVAPTRASRVSLGDAAPELHALPTPLSVADAKRMRKRDEYEVERVIGIKVTGSGVEYLVRWKSCSPADDSWEPPANVVRAQQLVDEFVERSNASHAPDGRGTSDLARFGRGDKVAAVHDAAAAWRHARRANNLSGGAAVRALDSKGAWYDAHVVGTRGNGDGREARESQLISFHGLSGVTHLSAHCR